MGGGCVRGGGGGLSIFISWYLLLFNASNYFQAKASFP